MATKPRLDPTGGVERLPGFGASSKKALADHGIETVADLLWTPPLGFDDLSAPKSLEAALREPPWARVVFEATVVSATVMPLRGRRCVRVMLRDRHKETCKAQAFWFFLAHHVMAIAKPGAEVLVVGRISAPEPKKPARLAHPEVFADTTEARVVRPRYPKLGTSAANVKKAVAHALVTLVTEAVTSPAAGAPIRIDPVPPSIASREKLGHAAMILCNIHAVGGKLPSANDWRAFREHLAWAEAFTRAWERLLAAEGLGGTPSVPLAPAPEVTAKLTRELGFELTADQRTAMDEISADLDRDKPMRRLLLGDVGSGKTAVALAAVAQCVTAGHQAAILAPTSVLAEQYLVSVKPLIRALGYAPSAAAVAFITAGTPAAERRRSEHAIARGEAKVIIGTHALLGESLVFPKLALVIVDEQQRLGVAQRMKLLGRTRSQGTDEPAKTTKKASAKSAKEEPAQQLLLLGAAAIAPPPVPVATTRPHLLTLSATPIPRTLALALRGELQTSTLRQMPRGRKAVKTELGSMASDLPAVVDRVLDAVDRGERVFWVVPRVDSDDEDDEDEDKSASRYGTDERADALREAMRRRSRSTGDVGSKVGVIHGRMAPNDKRAAMDAFRSGAAPILVATTVVEVGVDVPEATMMVIEHAERYGLSQLHQLRGRVGRSDRQGTCILLRGEEPLDADREQALAMQRLTALTRLTTGEEVAKADLELRGAGDLGGTRQHGEEDEELVYLDPAATYPWLEQIEADARAIRTSDPDLSAPDHRVLGSIVKKLQRAIAIREEAG